ncbi:MAG: ATP-binding protein [Gemmatimonadaceae bacterium]
MAPRDMERKSLPARSGQLVVPERNGIHDPSEIERIGRMLLGESQRTTAATYGPVYPREPVLFACKSVLDWHLPGQLSVKVGLSQAFAAKGRLYLRGATLGAGTSTLVHAAVRAYDQRNELMESPQRGQVVSFSGDSTRSESKFLAAFLGQLGFPEGYTAIRRGTDPLMMGVVAALARSHIDVLVIDHVDHLSPPVLRLLESLIEALDPKKRSKNAAMDTWLDRNYKPAVIMIGHSKPRQLFSRYKQLAGAIEGRIATLRLYDTIGEMAEAINSARIWKQPITLTNPDHYRMCELALQGTGGLPTNMQPVFEEVETLVRLNNAAPCPELIETIFEDRTFMLHVKRSVPMDQGEVEYTISVDDDVGQNSGKAAHGNDRMQDAEARTSTVANSQKPPSTRAEHLAQKRASVSRGAKEHRKLKRKKATLVRRSAPRQRATSS